MGWVRDDGNSKKHTRLCKNIYNYSILCVWAVKSLHSHNFVNTVNQYSALGINPQARQKEDLGLVAEQDLSWQHK